MRKIDGLIPTSYTDARAIGSGRLCANTRLQPTLDGEAMQLVLHHTAIIVYRKDGTIVLNSGNWRTVTTKARMNAALRPHGVSIVQRKGEWVVRFQHGTEITFFDGVQIDTEHLAFCRGVRS